MQCKTKNQSGLDFIGKDHKEIIKFLGLENFTIKLSRSREEIIKNQITLDKLETKPSKVKECSFFRNYNYEIKWLPNGFSLFLEI